VRVQLLFFLLIAFSCYSQELGLAIENDNTIVAIYLRNEKKVVLSDEEKDFAVLDTSSDGKWTIVYSVPKEPPPGRVFEEFFLLYLPTGVVVTEDVIKVDYVKWHMFRDWRGIPQIRSIQKDGPYWYSSDELESLVLSSLETES
jgi:hypothetical protein